MEQNIVGYINDLFKKLIDDYGFHKKNELNDGQSYSIEYSQNNFGIKIETYFREFYVSLYKESRPDYGINLFNLLEYLTHGDESIPKSNYFRKEIRNK